MSRPNPPLAVFLAFVSAVLRVAWLGKSLHVANAIAGMERKVAANITSDRKLSFRVIENLLMKRLPASELIWARVLPGPIEGENGL
jgi:hypothetical protein